MNDSIHMLEISLPAEAISRAELFETRWDNASRTLVMMTLKGTQIRAHLRAYGEKFPAKIGVVPPARAK